ncbi:MAG: EAL domain-containing protein [Candidatus Thiodiazotropha sp. (ex Monitilora ramsayi)]|nr:EAL domain-containing protein [Candidatus Thiodiazotropha sp. (ex Monitilora ramsayi)]
MGLRNRIFLATAILLLCHFLLQGFLDYRQIQADTLVRLQLQADTLRDVLLQQGEDGVQNVKPLHAQSPNIATGISAGFLNWADRGAVIRYVSERPINPGNRPDAIETKALQFFSSNPKAPEKQARFESKVGGSYIHYAQPILSESRCLGCHGQNRQQGAGVAKDQNVINGFRVGDLQGLISITLPASVTEALIAQAWQQGLLTHGAFFLLISLVFSRLLEKGLIGPTARLKAVVATMARNSDHRTEGVVHEDDLERVSQSLSHMADKIVQQEQALGRQKTLYSILSQTNKTIIRNESPQVIFESFCQIAVTYGCFSVAWIGEIRQREKGIRPLACAKNDGVAEERAFLSMKHDNPLGMSVAGACPVIIDQIDWQHDDVSWHLYPGRAVGQSAAVLPIMLGSQVKALLVVYAVEANYFDDAVRDLLEEVVSDLAFAMGNYERNQAHKVAHRELEASSARLAQLNRQMRLLLESTGEGIFGVDKEGNCSFINKAAAGMLGYQQRQLLNQPIHEQIRMPELYQQPFNDGMAKLKAPRKVKDESFRRQDGSIFPVEYSTYPIMENGEVQGSVSVFRDMTETRSMLREMRFLASHDPLTHLLNRHAFDQRLREAFSDAKDFAIEHVLCYMDLDQFKVVNDTCGHVAGDTMLRQLSHHLRQAIGADGVLARLGGDEFGLLLERCSLNDGLQVTERIFDTVKRFRFIWEGRSFSCAVSIGVAMIDPNMESPHNVLSAADTACYVAKDMGRNRLHVYRPYDEEISRQQGEMRWVNRIESAIQKEQFSLLQQPIMSLATHAIGDEHVEMLLRMHDGQGGVITPGAFIPAAERYNLMGSLDRWVIRNTFDWLSRNPGRMEELGACSINLSGQSLGDGSLHEYILEQLREFGLPAEKISFEITETAVVNRLDQATRFISLLKRRGFRFALDDFGTGVSSFAYLKSLPVDYLKIDGSFVKNMLNDPVDRAMVESINRIGHLMGLQTIAEYVESDQILEQLIEIGVDYAQGYGVMKPRPLTSIGYGAGPSNWS